MRNGYIFCTEREGIGYFTLYEFYADIFMKRLISCTYMLAEYKLSSHIGGLSGWGIFFGKS